MAKQGYRQRKWGQTIDRRTVKLPTNTVEKLKLLKSIYEDEWGRPMTYDSLIERLLSSEGLGHLDPPVYAKFRSMLESRKDLDEVTRRSTEKFVVELAERAKAKGTSLKEEAAMEQRRVKEELADLRKEEESEEMTRQFEDMEVYTFGSKE